MGAPWYLISSIFSYILSLKMTLTVKWNLFNLTFKNGNLMFWPDKAKTVFGNRKKNVVAIHELVVRRMLGAFLLNVEKQVCLKVK